MIKDEIQSKAVELSKQKSNLFLEWATGTGKTKAALDIVSKLSGRGYIILSETAHKTNWIEEIYKYGYQDLLGRCHIILYASIHKLADTEVDWVIYDEIHNGLSDKRLKNIKSIKSNNNILLTATLDGDAKTVIGKIFKDLYTYTITLKQAIEWELVPEPEINIIGIDLKVEGQNQEFIINKGLDKKRIKKECTFNERWSILKKHKDISLKVKCTQQQKYNWLNEQIDYWKGQYFRKRESWQEGKWMQYTIQRKRFLAEIKTPYALEIVHKLTRKNKRFICFAGSIPQAEILGSKTDVVHSKNKNNQQIINNFNSKKISRLFAIGMLQEGMNLKDIEEGVIVQLDAKTRRYCQKSGRMFRANKPVQHILYIKNTRDEEFLENALEELTEYIKT